MSQQAEIAALAENAFLAGVEAAFARDAGRALGASSSKTARFDEGAAVRAALAARRMFDRELPSRLPQNRRVVWKGYRRRWWLARRRTAVAIATVLAPPDSYVATIAGDAPQPVGLNELLEHINRIAPERNVPHVIGVCSPSGFAPDVKASHIDLPNVTLVGVEPRPEGGWTVSPLSERCDPRFVRLFDPEGAEQKVRRAGEAVRQRSDELIAGSLSANRLAEQLGLPGELVTEAFRREAAANPDLRISDGGPDVLLFRGAAGSKVEDSEMSVGDWIRQLFGLAGNEAKKINAITERRAELSQRRDRLYEDVAKLEQREADLLEQGRQNTSQVVRRRVASQLAQHRRDMSRLNTMAAMLSQQINVLSTHIHNLELIQQGRIAKLPSSDDLAQDAVKAEEMLEQLKSDMDLVGTLDSGVNEVLVTQDELDILKEFEQADRKAEAASTPPQAGQAVEPPAAEPKPREKGTPEAS